MNTTFTELKPINMTTFEDLTKQPPQEKRTVLTHCLQIENGKWKAFGEEYIDDYVRIVYLGSVEGEDYFAAYNEEDGPNYPFIWKGIKGTEFK